jgi:ABC-2 type transport system ATP-binding protein
VTAAVAIETTELTKRYGRGRGVEQLSLTVPRGEVFGFLGPNGAGKTTTIRLLLGLLRPSSGSAAVFGHDVWRDGIAARACMGYLPGDFGFDDRVTGAEMLDLLADLRHVADRAFVRSLARRFDADLTRPIGELSRGNRQKLGLLQALVHRPAIVVMDEPTSGLDPLVQEEFGALIDELRDEGTTVFVSSHNLPEVERLCSRVGILREGRLVAVERVETLTDRALRRVRIRFTNDVPAEEFARLPGVGGLRTDGARLTFTVAGSLDSVVQAAARHHVADLEISRPSLEDAFVAFYAHEQGRQPA